ncbi:Pentatricopeptide repeat-containing protein [Quillaja saponaria]|uniref:Pentatricopeptide repeat-containing protein n=1 Tax=Quillaja saponaria TaxID=32244 RepID=A0AAD7Q0G6_QUISA|nr:Pentatricopeptide repeat-containing protein [Quillaja saponaria]
MGFHSYIHISNALISMYCKCGAIQDAFCMFQKMDNKNVVSWNSMIAGYAQHGLALEAINLFQEMKWQGITPDSITYLGVLSSCRRAGLVEEGRLYFSSMVQHGMQPELDHNSCVVDLLGRAELLQEAQYFVVNMPVSPNAILSGSLLSSRRLHGSVWIGIQAAESRILLEQGCSATLIQLAKLYASIGWWDQVARVRKLMKDKELKTNRGCSWIEVKNKVYQFGAEDRGNANMTESLLLMDSLIDHMTSLGYQPEVHDEEIEDA